MSASRTPFVDQVRGIALLGIALVNAPFIAISLSGERGSAEQSALDSLVAFCIQAFAQGKFYLLFSFLFGYSVSRFMRPETADGSRKFRRRLAALAVLGILHAFLFFIGDILFSYAVLGCVLLLVLKKPDSVVLRGAKVSAGIAVVILLCLTVLASHIPEADSAEFGSAAFDRIMRTGTFLDTIAARVSNWPFVLGFLAVMNYGFIFSMMCLGVVAGRRGLLDDPKSEDLLWVRCRSVGLILGLPLGILSGLFSQEIWATALGFGSAPLMTAGYLGFLVLLSGKSPKSLSFFASAGQMSLTCYLFESILLSAVFCGWGLGFYGRFGVAAVSGIAIAVWLFIELGANLWLTRHATGPFERLVALWSSAVKR